MSFFPPIHREGDFSPSLLFCPFFIFWTVNCNIPISAADELVNISFWPVYSKLFVVRFPYLNHRWFWMTKMVTYILWNFQKGFFSFEAGIANAIPSFKEWNYLYDHEKLTSAKLNYLLNWASTANYFMNFNEIWFLGINLSKNVYYNIWHSQGWQKPG